MMVRTLGKISLLSTLLFIALAVSAQAASANSRDKADPRLPVAEGNAVKMLESTTGQVSVPEQQEEDLSEQPADHDGQQPNSENVSAPSETPQNEELSVSGEPGGLNSSSSPGAFRQPGPDANSPRPASGWRRAGPFTPPSSSWRGKKSTPGNNPQAREQNPSH